MWLTLVLLVLEIVAKLPQIEEAIKAIIALIKGLKGDEKIAHAKRLRKTIRAFLNGKKNATDTLKCVQEHLADLQAKA